MKKLLLLLTIMLISVILQGQVSKTVTDLSPGGLINKLTVSELTSVTNLTLSGTIDARDFFQIREKMTRLAVIDLTNVTVAEYTGIEGAQSGELLTFPANALPGGAFIAMANLTSVTLPATITSIGNGSFQNNGKLSFINIPSSLTSIGVHAFVNCKSLTAITIPASVASIGTNAFSESNIQVGVAAENLQYSSAEGVLFNKDQSLLIYCPASKSGNYIIPSTVKSISDYAFFTCAELTAVTIPETVTAIGYWVFSKCSGLISVNIPSAVTTIGESAFLECSSLASIDIPGSVTSIGMSAFAGCSSLSSVTLPESITTIAKNTFTFCTALTSVRIPGSVTSIESNAFNNCTSLTSVTIPQSVTSIGIGAFSRCPGLTSVAIPESVTAIATQTFSRCTALTSLIIPGSVSSIGSNAFSECTGLKSVSIPNSVTSIGENAFNLCTQLTSVYAYPTSPVSLPSAYVFGGVNKNTCTLYVPAGSKELYQVASVWSSFTRMENISPLSQRDIKTRKVTLWPNPAKDMITIAAEKGLVHIYNSTGGLAMSQSLENSKVINIRQLHPGAYVVVINGESFKMIKK